MNSLTLTPLLTPRCRCHVTLSLVQTNTDLAREGQGAADAPRDEKFIHSCYLYAIWRAEFKNMNQLQSQTQLFGHNACILIDVNLDTLKPVKSHTLFYAHTHTLLDR